MTGSATAVATPRTTSVAALLPDYEISRELGRGAMGIVYLGRHKKLGRNVAVKELSANLADDPEVRSRFLTEARTLAALNHPNIVPIYDYVENEGRCLLIMEALPGGSVWELFEKNGLALEKSCSVVLATCAAVQHAHEHGVLHRDIKPENLLLTANGDVKVADFGIAKVISGSRTLATMDGSVLGTPAYMAPEQAEGAAVGPPADVYAIGTMFYEFVSGRLPFEGDSPMSMLVQRITSDPRPVLEVAPNVPAPIASVIMRALERDPAKRIPGAGDLARSLSEAAKAVFGAAWTSGLNLPDSPTRIGSAGADSQAPRPVNGAGAATVAPLRGQKSANTGQSPDPTPTVADHTEADQQETDQRETAPEAAASSDAATPSSDAALPDAPLLDPNATVAPRFGVPVGSVAAETVDPGPAPSHSAATVFHRTNDAPATGGSNVAVAVKPSAPHHGAAFDAARLDRSQLVGIESVIKPAAPLAIPLAVMFTALVAAVALFLWAPSSPSATADPSLSTLAVNGQTPTASGAVRVDLLKPFVVSGIGNPATRRITVDALLLGAPIASFDAPVRSTRATVDPGKAAGWAVHGPLVLKIATHDAAGTTLASREIAVRNSSAPWRSAQVPLAGVLLAAALSSAESQSRRHRKGRVRNASVVGATLAGALVGLSGLLVWVTYVGKPVALPQTIAACVATSVVFGALTVVRARRARRRRLRWKADR